MKALLGAGSDSWGIWHAAHPAQIPWQRYVAEVAKAGYRYIEPGNFGYFPRDPKESLRTLDDAGLRIPGGTFFCDLLGSKEVPLQADLRETAAWLSAVGAEYLVLLDRFARDPDTGTYHRPFEMNETEWDRMAHRLNHFGAITRNDYGLALVFHPHCDATVSTEAQIAKLLSMTEPGVADLCIDTGHHIYSGGDPAAFFRVHSARIPYIHLKSMNRGMLDTVRREDLPWAVAVERGVTDEPERGAVDFPAFAVALHETNYQGYAILEQDMFPCDPEVPLPLARRSIAYLQTLGFAI